MKGIYTMINFLPNDSFIHEAKLAKFQPTVVIQILIFIIILIATSFAQAIPIGIVMFAQVFTSNNFDIKNPDSIQKLITKVESSRTTLVAELISTVIITFLVIIYCRCIEKRSFRSMGFVKKRAVPQYLIGMIIGFAMFSACVLICVLTNSLEYKGIIAQGNVLIIVLFFIGFLFQGMEEEVIMRGYLMPSLSNKIPIVAAILLNSVLFSMLHLANDGITALAFINLILYGIFISVYVIRTNSLWGACAIHSVWNFVQGNFYGIFVSGLDTKTSVFSFTTVDNGELFNGGKFGLEGGLAVTFVLILTTTLTLLITGNNKSKENTEQGSSISSIQ